MSVWMRHSIVFLGLSVCVCVCVCVCACVSASKRRPLCVLIIAVFCVYVLISVSVLNTTRHSDWKLSIGEQKHHHRVTRHFKTSTPSLSLMSHCTLKQRRVEITPIRQQQADLLTSGFQCFKIKPVVKLLISYISQANILGWSVGGL